MFYSLNISCFVFMAHLPLCFLCFTSCPYLCQSVAPVPALLYKLFCSYIYVIISYTCPIHVSFTWSYFGVNHLSKSPILVVFAFEGFGHLLITFVMRDVPTPRGVRLGCLLSRSLLGAVEAG